MGRGVNRQPTSSSTMGFTYISCDRQRGEFYSIVNTASRLVRGNSGTLVRRQSPAEPPSHDPIAMAGLQQWARTLRHCRRVRLATKPESCSGSRRTGASRPDRHEKRRRP